MKKTIFVTGGDEKYFLMGCWLLHSLRKFSSALPIYFLDFGLNQMQRAFLQNICILVDRPPELGLSLHHFALKAAMGKYLHNIPWSNFIWIDSDMIVVRPFQERLSTLLREMTQNNIDVAACVDSSSTLKNFVASAIARKQHVLPFIDALGVAGVSSEEPYLNSGFVVCRSRDLFEQWHRTTESLTPHLLFEQNAFNLAVRKHYKFMILPAEEWNFHGHEMLTRPANMRAMMLHPTSDDPNDLLRPAWVEFGKRRIYGQIKLFRNPILLSTQESVMFDFLRASHVELERLGIMI
jgi:lipopolysaccharide biosynthesis glycosyltransferase